MPVNDALASEQWIRFSYCRDRGHLDFINKADKCDKYFCGEQWLQSDLNALALQRRPAICAVDQVVQQRRADAEENSILEEHGDLSGVGVGYEAGARTRPAGRRRGERSHWVGGENHGQAARTDRPASA